MGKQMIAIVRVSIGKGQLPSQITFFHNFPNPFSKYKDACCFAKRKDNYGGLGWSLILYVTVRHEEIYAIGITSRSQL